MKRILALLFLFILGFSSPGSAQQDPQSGKIRAMRVSYLTTRLNLSEQQSTKFWPVYNRYSDDRRALRNEYRKLFKGGANGSMSKVEASIWIDDNIEYQEKELALKKKYKDELLKIISAQQLASLYQAERDFKKELIEHLRKDGN